MPETVHSTRLFLVIGPAPDLPSADEIVAALDAGDVACILFRADPGGWIDAGLIQHLMRLAQDRGVAVLLENDCSIARAMDADGVHLSGAVGDIEQRYRQARDALGPEAIVGVATGLARHEAMTVAELGASYIALGEGDFDHCHGTDDALGDVNAVSCDTVEQVAWWADLFEVPCIAWSAASPEAAAAYAGAKADFVAIEPRGVAGAELAEFVARAQSLLQARRLAA